MKIFKGLTLLAGIQATCPNAHWTLDADGTTCVPGGAAWSTACTTDGQLQITADIHHFYEMVPDNIKGDLIFDLKNIDGWGDVAGEADQLTKTVALTFSQVDVSGVSYIRGEYSFGPTASAYGPAYVNIGTTELTLATPLSYTVTCDYESEITINMAEVGLEVAGTFGGESNTNSLDIGATISGADGTSNLWTLGDAVTITVDDNTDASLEVQIAIEQCTAYSDSAYTNHPITISHGTCAVPALNGATANSGANPDFVTVVSFDAFKYTADSGSALDNTAYVQCDLRVCLVVTGVVDAACALLVAGVDAAAASNTDVLC